MSAVSGSVLAMGKRLGELEGGESATLPTDLPPALPFASLFSVVLGAGLFAVPGISCLCKRIRIQVWGEGEGKGRLQCAHLPWNAFCLCFYFFFFLFLFFVEIHNSFFLAFAQK